MQIDFLKANNGDSILIKILSDGKTRNILVDGGMQATYHSSSENKSGPLKIAIQNIKENGEKIDLLILTHIDEDHIGGILNWFKRDSEAYKLIGKIWFNSAKIISGKIGTEANEDLKVMMSIFSDQKTSVQQGIDFENYITEHSLWDQKLIFQGSSFSEGGLEIEVISPTMEILEKLVKLYKKKSKDYFTSKEANDYGRSIRSLIDEENDPSYEFEEDDSPTNGSSIAFLMKFTDKNFLFLGDSHPGIISEYLVKKGYSADNPLHAEIVKLSHHGSSYNTSRELLSLIKTDNYFVSTSGEKHEHPHKRTISRIVNQNANANILFNYENIANAVFSMDDSNDYIGITIKTIKSFTENG